MSHEISRLPAPMRQGLRTILDRLEIPAMVWFDEATGARMARPDESWMVALKSVLGATFSRADLDYYDRPRAHFRISPACRRRFFGEEERELTGFDGESEH